MPGETPRSQTSAHDRWLLLGEKRNEVLDLTEGECTVATRSEDPDYVSIYGLRLGDWYARGVWVLGRTTVECTRDRFADLIARDVATAAMTAPDVSGSFVVDPFAGSAIQAYELVDADSLGQRTRRLD